MNEIIFLVEDDAEGGFRAQAIGDDIFTEADTYEELKAMVIDSVRCHFDDQKQRVIRLHYVKDEVIAA